MPIYEYQCQKCQHQFEELIRGNEKPVCPACSAKRVEKLLSATSISTASASLPVSGGCGNPSAPPCGPACGRWPG